MSRLRTGARGEELFRTTLGAVTVTVHALDPEADADLLHAWMTQPRAAFWGLGHLTRDEVRDTYLFVESLPTHHAYLLRWDGEPVALLQAYHPEDDPVASAYEVQEGDVGLHFFLRGGRAPGGGSPWPALGAAVVAFLFAGPGVSRLVAEPDARNAAAVARVEAVGFELGDRVTFDSASGPKDAQLAFLTRARAQDLLRLAG